MLEREKSEASDSYEDSQQAVESFGALIGLAAAFQELGSFPLFRYMHRALEQHAESSAERFK